MRKLLRRKTFQQHNYRMKSSHRWRNTYLPHTVSKIRSNQERTFLCKTEFDCSSVRTNLGAQITCLMSLCRHDKIFCCTMCCCHAKCGAYRTYRCRRGCRRQRQSLKWFLPGKHCTSMQQQGRKIQLHRSNIGPLQHPRKCLPCSHCMRAQVV
jgi:hypothetical protein